MWCVVQTAGKTHKTGAATVSRDPSAPGGTGAAGVSAPFQEGKTAAEMTSSCSCGDMGLGGGIWCSKVEDRNRDEDVQMSSRKRGTGNC
jgi:hypothetical protein